MRQGSNSKRTAIMGHPMRNSSTRTRHSCLSCDSKQMYSGVWYKERMLQRTVLSIKSGCYDEHRCYNERGGILSAEVARACAWRVGPSRSDWASVIRLDCLCFLLGKICSWYSLRKDCLCCSNLHGKDKGLPQQAEVAQGVPGRLMPWISWRSAQRGW